MEIGLTRVEARLLQESSTTRARQPVAMIEIEAMPELPARVNLRRCRVTTATSRLVPGTLSKHGQQNT